MGDADAGWLEGGLKKRRTERGGGDAVISCHVSHGEVSHIGHKVDEKMMRIE